MREEIRQRRRGNAREGLSELCNGDAICMEGLL